MDSVDDRAWWRRVPVVLLLAIAAVAARLPFLQAPLASDEGGFLLVGSQWHAGGTSLYGDYWVDRPPLLIGLFGLADAAGGAPALRVLGCLAALAVVLLAWLVARSVAGRPAGWPVLAAAALVSTPLLGVREVDGELLAIPFVLTGLLLAVRADARRGWPRAAGWCAAGVAGAAAAAVKQNFIDVFVFGAVLVAGRLAGKGFRSGLSDLAALGVGGVVGLGSALGLASARGTTPGGLWDALVVFRARAAHLIGTAATDATPERFGHVVLVLAVSGSPLVIGTLILHAVRRPLHPQVPATGALLGWELFGVLAGGSYWLHYLIGLIPGLMLAVAILDSAAGRLRTAIRAVTAYTLVVAVVSIVVFMALGDERSDSTRASQWLAGQVRPGDTGVVLYGNPQMLWNAHLTSPYPELWSLPVRVRDPDLVELTAVLNSPEAPTWVLAWDDMESWAIDPAQARAVVVRRYHLAARVCGLDVYRLGPSPTLEPAPTLCPE